MNKVTENRRKGDQNPELSLLAEVFQLLGNSAYGKIIEGLERQTTVKYTKDENILMKDLRSVWLQDLEELGDVYEIEMRKRQVVINRTLSSGNRGLPDGQAANITVLLRLFGPISRQARFRADADGHKQPLFWPVKKKKAGRGCSTVNAGGI